VAHFYHQDALGSTVRITDGSGQVEESYAYDVFGAVAIKDGAGNPLTASAIGNRFLFTGREWLKDVGLYDYRNRVYSQDLGRFLQTDPIRFKAGDVNIYRYVDNDPLNQIDPDGTSAIIMKLAVWAAKKGLQECVKKECKEPCAQCCAVVGGAGFAALTTGYTAGMLSCAVFTHPALILTCVAAYTAFDVKLSVELGQSVADCTAACESKKSIKPPDCCKP
jgi:RHS repeat-associated protein